MSGDQLIRDGSSTVATNEELQGRSRDVPWYVKDLNEVPDAAREVLESYSKIAPDKVRDHVYQVRERAWDVWPFPCLGGWRFLNLNLHTTPEYNEVLSRLRKGEKLLDLGCCFGQELRRAIFDGAPGSNMYGADLRPEYFSLGYDLFLDRDKCEAEFIAVDVFNNPEKLSALEGKMSIIYTGAFFHLFDREQQLYIAKLVSKLFKQEAGGILLGRQVGSTNPGLYEHKTNPGEQMYRHNEQTWRDLWEEAGRETEIDWKVDVELRDVYRQRDNRLADENVRELRFCVRRM